MMSEQEHLRAVTDDEAPLEPATIVEAAEQSERAVLVALRTHLARKMDDDEVSAHALAGISAKVREYDREIRALDVQSEQEVGKRGPSGDETWRAV